MDFVSTLLIIAACYLLLRLGSYVWSRLNSQKHPGVEEEDRWRNILVNKAREKEIEDYVKDPKNKEAILETLQDSLRTALGDDFRNMLHGDGTFLWNEAVTLEINFGYWTKELLLSREGLVSERASSRGYCADGGNPVQIDRKIDLVHECERNLRKFHPELRLYYTQVTSWNPIHFRFIFQYYHYKKVELMTLWDDP